MNTETPLGAIPTHNGCRFSVWAPHADEVFVTGTFNDWNKTDTPLTRNEQGIWTGEADAKPGDEYRYRIVADGKEYTRIDPYARRVTQSDGNAIIVEPHRATESGFTPAPLNEMVIYELHIGTFGKTDGGEETGSFAGVTGRLNHLAELGINAIEIMPPAEFAGCLSWGYNPSHLFAIESCYGTPDDFTRLVDEAHKLGIAVLVDVVFNHLGPTDLDMWQFDGWSENGGGGIYFYNDWKAETPWGTTRPDYGRDEVRRFIRDSALMWIAEYGADGLRWDMTAFIRNVHGRDDDGGGDLPDGWSLMQWVNAEAAAARPTAIAIAEDLQDNPALTQTQDEGGAGFHCQWGPTFVHTIREALIAPDDAHRDMDAVAGAIVHNDGGDAFRRVIYTESHDEVSNGNARVPEEVDPGKASSWAAKKKSSLGAALVLTAPGVPMIFQGQEFLEDDWFRDEDPIDWSRKERFAGIFRLYRDLIALRLNRGGVTRGLTGHGVDVIYANSDDNLVVFHRWAEGGPKDSVVVVANFSTLPRENYAIGLPSAGRWVVRFNSDCTTYDDEFGGMGGEFVEAEPAEGDGQPAQGSVSVAAYSVLILSQD